MTSIRLTKNDRTSFRAAREALGFSQDALARAFNERYKDYDLKRSGSSVGNIERGESAPRVVIELFQQLMNERGRGLHPSWADLKLECLGFLRCIGSTFFSEPWITRVFVVLVTTAGSAICSAIALYRGTA